MAKGHKDKVAVITGAANGIGQAFAKRLAEDGVHVAIADIGDGRRDREAGRAGRPPGAGLSMRRVVGGVGRRHGRGGADEIRPRRHPDQLRRHLPATGISPTMTFADWRHVLSINLDGVFLVSAAFVPGMRAARMGPHRQHGVVDARLGGHRLCALRRQQGRHRRLHPRAGERARPATASPSTRSRRG